MSLTELKGNVVLSSDSGTTTTIGSGNSTITNFGAFIYDKVSLPSGYVLTNSLQGDTFVPGYNRVMNRIVQTDMLARDVFRFQLETLGQRILQSMELIVSGTNTGAVNNQAFAFRATYVVRKTVGLSVISVLSENITQDVKTFTGLALTYNFSTPSGIETILNITPPVYSGSTGAVYVATCILYGGDDGTGKAIKVTAV